MMRMMSLTTAQRDLLHQLLSADAPISAAALSQQLHLTPRQIRYGLHEIKAWLSRYQATLRHTPGVGAQVICTPAQRQRLLADLVSQARFQLILTAEQRQQLLGLQLLDANGPLLLMQFQDAFAVARATVLKDLEVTAPWLARFQLLIGRRQHRGFWLEGSELAKRQALSALLWGDVPFERPIMALDAGQRIVFVLAADAALLPAVAQADALVAACDLKTAQQWVERAESELGGRFADEAAVRLALGLAVQLHRVERGQFVVWSAEDLAWLQQQGCWPVAADLASALWPNLPTTARTAESAALALLLLSHERDEPWRSDLGAPALSPALSDFLLKQIANELALPELAHDQLLRAGLEAHMLPACVRQRFALWTLTRTSVDAQAERYGLEPEIAARLTNLVGAVLDITLPPDAQDDLILLLRAAVVRARPERARRVLVICPSGMATTQLLVARLKARFPRLGALEVLPIRALSPERVANADLIIATVPLNVPFELPIDVIQVHPILKPEDVLALSQWLA